MGRGCGGWVSAWVGWSLVWKGWLVLYLNTRQPCLPACLPISPGLLRLLCLRSQPFLAGDGALSEDDMEIVLRQLAGSSLGDEELKSIIAKVGGWMRGCAGMRVAGGGPG